MGRQENESSSDSDSEYENGQFWHFRPRPAPAQHHRPDTSTVQQCEISPLTRSALPARPHHNIAAIIASRQLGGGFSIRDKRHIYSKLLPHNSKKVKSSLVISSTFSYD